MFASLPAVEMTPGPGHAALAAAEAGIVQFLIRDPRGIFKRHDIELEIDTNKRKEKIYQKSLYMGVVQKVLVLRVVFDDLWYAKMTFGES